MGWLLPILSGLMTSDVQDAVARTKRAAAFYVAIAVLALTAYVFLMLAAYLKLAEIRGSLDAALILGVGTVAASGIVCGAMSIAATVARRRMARRHAELRGQLAVAMSAVPLVLRFKPLLMAAALGALVVFGTGRNRSDAD